MTKSEKMIFAAKLRSKILGEIQKSESGLTKEQIKELVKGDLSNLGYADSYLDNFLFNMKMTKVVSGIRVFGEKMKYVPYQGSMTTLKSKQNSVSIKQPKKNLSKKLEMTTAGSPGGLTVDLIKSTGRVRITFGNVVIDVGVID